jgi:hypothetical protein
MQPWMVISIAIGMCVLVSLEDNSDGISSDLCRNPRNMLLLHTEMFPEAKSKGRQERYEGSGPEVGAALGVVLQGEGPT